MSKIEWTGKTWNPTVGCRRVSPGCDSCYAIFEAHRKPKLFAHYVGVTENVGGVVDWTGIYNVAPDHILEKPLRSREPTVWFVNSMSDLFGEGVDDVTIKRVFEIMNATQHHTYQVLTKRPNRAAKLAAELDWTPNIWMGTSIEFDKYVGRVNLLEKIPAAVRFISAEPLLGPLPSLNLSSIDWLIAGGESGRSRDKIRPIEIEWVRDLRDRCVESKTAFFFKQWGNWSATGEWCRSKAEAGRILDGLTWDEMPVAQDRREPQPVTWSSIAHFCNELADEHALEAQPPMIGDQSPRIALREPIWRKLVAEGPMTGQLLRDAVLSIEAESARMVNYHAWALVDLQAMGWVESYIAQVQGKRGRVKRAKLYRATKPRIRVPAREVRT